MANARWWLVSYDIRDPDRLRRAAKHLLGYGARMQYSVFRCWMTDQEMQCLRWELTELLAPEDDVLLIPLCPRCVKHIQGTHAATKPTKWPDEPEKHRIV